MLTQWIVIYLLQCRYQGRPARSEVSVSSDIRDSKNVTFYKVFLLGWVHGIFVMEHILIFQLLYCDTVSDSISLHNASPAVGVACRFILILSFATKVIQLSGHEMLFPRPPAVYNFLNNWWVRSFGSLAAQSPSKVLLSTYPFDC